MNNLLREMQEEFRNSQFINIYFHKFAPSRLFFPWLALVPSPFPPPPPAPQLFADPVSPTASLLVSARRDRLCLPFSASVTGVGRGCVFSPVSLFSPSLRPESLPGWVHPCLCLPVSISGCLYLVCLPSLSHPRTSVRVRMSWGGAAGVGNPRKAQRGRGRFPDNRRA